MKYKDLMWKILLNDNALPSDRQLALNEVRQREDWETTYATLDRFFVWGLLIVAIGQFLLVVGIPPHHSSDCEATSAFFRILPHLLSAALSGILWAGAWYFGGVMLGFL